MARPAPTTTRHAADTRGVHLWLVLVKAFHALEQHALRSVGSRELCSSDFAVLEVLLSKGPLPVNTIGKKVLLTSGSITQAVDRLEKKGLVRRQADAEDRRARIVHLTAAGRAIIEPAFQEHERVMEQAASCLPGRERTTLLRLLKKLGNHAEALHEENSAPAEPVAPPWRRSH